MPYIPEAIPPEAIPEAPPEETTTPVVTDQAAPPMTDEQRYGIAPAQAPVETTAAAAAPPMTDEQRYGIGTEQEVPPPPDNRMGGLVDPLMAQAPEPVRNLANIVGQPVGGLVDAVQAIGGQLGQGDIPGAAEQTLPAIGAPQMRQREQAGQRIINDQPVTLTAQDMPQHGILSPILDPIANSAVGQAIGGVLTAPLPGTQNLPPPPTAIGGAALGSDPGAALTGQPGTVLGPLGIQDWWDSLPPEDQAALSAQGGNAVIDAFETYINASPIPPPNLSNPLDAGKPGDNPLQRGAAILGAIPGSAGAWGDTIQTGTLGPFLKNQAIEAMIDPALLVPHLVGEAVLGAGKSLLRRTPGVSRLGELTTEAQRAIQGERIGTAAEEVVNSRAVLNDAGVAPADPLTQGAGSPPPNGRQSPTIDPGQAGSAAPPIPEPPQIVERPVAGMGSIFEVQQDGRVRGQFPTRESAEEFVNPRPRTAPPDPERPRTIPDREPIRVATERVAIDEDIARRVRSGEITPQEAVRQQKERPRPTAPKAAQAPPSRTALGITKSNWVRLVNGKEERVVVNKRIRPEFQADVRRVYEDMKTAPADQFWEPFPGTIKDVNVPIGDEGAYARYRAAMNQGYYLFDDWGTDRAVSRLPPKLQSSPGVIAWDAVEQEAANPASPFADNAQRALAGKNAVHLYTYRIENAPNVRGPDGLTGADIEVEHLLLNYHLDQLSERFKKAQFGENTSYWRDRADMLSEVLRRSGYLPSDAALAKWRGIDLAATALEAYPEIAGTIDLRRLQGKSLLGRGPNGADLLAHLPDSATRTNRIRPLYALTDTQYYASDLITPETRPALEAALRDRLDKYGLSDVALRLVDTLSDVIRDAPEDARGVYQPYERVMTLALREADDLPLTQGERVGLVLDHEVIHALRGLDLFTADEWDTLVRTAKEQGIGPAMVSDDYAALEAWNPQMAQEELVAHLYEAWRIGKVTLGRRPASIIEKLFQFFRGLGQALKDTYPEEILHAIENGDIGRRPRTITPAVERPAASLGNPERFAAARPQQSLPHQMYHGSRTRGLETLMAELPPESRRFLQEFTRLGVFMSPDLDVARSYARKSGIDAPGAVYTVNAPKNPLFVNFTEFYHRVENEGADAVRADLISKGYDGVALQGSNYEQTVSEVISLHDAPVLSEEQWALRMRKDGFFSLGRRGIEEADPPVAAGFTRLYRGESRTPRRVLPRPGTPEFNTLSWLDQERVLNGAHDATGRWFTPNPEIAAWYVDEADLATGSGRLSYIDVPNDQLSKFAVSNIPEAQRFSADAGNEYFVSRNLADGATEVRDSSVREVANRSIQERRLGTPNDGRDALFALRMKQAQRRQAAAAATSAAPEAVRQAVDDVADPHFTRYGETTSEQAARDLAQSADGLFHFRDGWKVQGSGMTVDDLLRQTLNDVEFWANVERISKENGGWSDTRSTTMMRQWQQLDQRFNSDGSVDRSLLAGPANDLERLKARQEYALKVFQEAEQRARPKDKPTRIGAINAGYLDFVRTSMLFNYLNIPRYTLQNLLTNSINMGARIGAAGNWDLWTHPADFGRIFKANRAAGRGESYLTRWGSLEKQIGMGSKPNIAQSHVKYMGEKGRLPKYLDRASRVIAPETLRYVGTTADQIFRETAADTVVNREFRKLNRDLVSKVMRELDSRGLRIPDAKVRQVVHDFLDENRARIDANTGEAYRTMLGRPATGEPVWNPEGFGQYLKQHLTEDMLHKPDPGDFNRAIDRITRDSKTRVRGILDTAEQSVDDAFFSWRDTNADAQLRKFFLYHYWTTRQGGFFLQEAIKRPVLLSSYGRMMAEMKQQAEDLEQPPWMTGFFQFQNSVAGLSTWGSPFDIVQSVLSFADWQEGSEDDKYKDLTALGKGASTIPFLIHPALQFVAYELGLLGPDYYPPMVTGTETFGANAINLLNLANAQGKLPDWVPGHDANGNPVPLPVRPLQELYARVGNALSSALAPLTGLSPVEVQNMAGSQQRNIASFLETETRRAYPEWDQMRVNAFVTEKLQDPGSPEYQAALRKSADMPFQLMDGMPGIISGAARLASPIQIYSWPEQYNLDRWPVTPSGYVPERNIPHLNEIDPATGELTPAGERAKYVAAAAKYGATTTPEGRQIANEQNEWYALEPLDYAEANKLAGKLYGIWDGNIDETVTIGGVGYTPEMLRSLERGDMYELGTQALADAGYTREQQTAIEDAQARYLADHPDLAGYFEYKDLIKANPNGVEGFVNETVAVNPGFRQFVRSSMMDHITGEIDYGHAEYVDAYLASQGIRPSVYSPIVGNEPSTVPGGYPALSGGKAGQPLLPPVTATEPIPAYSKPVAADDWGKDKYQVAWIDPAIAGKMQVIANPDQYSKGMSQVLLHDGTIGYVDASYLQNAAPPQPSTPPGRAPAPVIDQGGLASWAGKATGLLGQAKDAIVGGITSLAGHNSGTPTKPDADGMPAGAYNVVAGNDGFGVQSTADGSDRTWMEMMVGDHNAIVTTDYKGPTPAGVSYEYQIGHNADASTHSAYDISCDSGYRPDGSSTCPGTPIKAPISGKVVCAGYGKGTGEAMASPNCTYSQNTTKPGSAHDVVLDVGTDVNGNAIQLSFSHMGTSNVEPGQQVNVGDLLGGMGDTDGGPHIHLEAWGWCPSANTYYLLDPQLVVGGYYKKNAVC